MRYATLVAALGAALWAVGCSSKTESPSVTTTTEGQQTTGTPGKDAAYNNAALVRFFNADPQQAAVSVISQKKTAFANVAYKSITPYVEFERGVTQFSTEGNGSDKSTSARRELFPGRHYTLIALPGKKGGTRLETFSDDLGKLDPNQARVRLINATTSGDELNLYVQGTNTRILRGSDSGEIVAVAEMYAATVEIRPERKSVTKAFSDLTVDPGRLYTFIAVNNGAALDVVQIEDRVEP